MSSEPSCDSKWCCCAIGGVLGQNACVREAGGEWGGAEGFWNVMGWLGPGVCQFGLSERLGGLCRGSLCGGGSLRTSWDHGTCRWDLWGVSPSLRRAGGTYRVARGVRYVLLRENVRIASRSCDLFRFREGGIVYVGGRWRLGDDEPPPPVRAARPASSAA